MSDAESVLDYARRWRKRQREVEDYNRKNKAVGGALGPYASPPLELQQAFWAALARYDKQIAEKPQ